MHSICNRVVFEFAQSRHHWLVFGEKRVGEWRVAFSLLVIALVCLLLGKNVVSEEIPDNPYAYDIDRSCGVLCCGFLHRFYGGRRSYRDIVSVREPQRRGSSFTDLAVILESLGHRALPIEAKLDDIQRLRIPAILSVKRDSRSHYVVFLPCRSDASKLLVFDPPKNLGHLSMNELREIYSGKALVVGDSISIERVRSEIQKAKTAEIMLQCFTGVAVLVIAASVVFAVRWLRFRRSFVMTSILPLVCLAFISCRDISQPLPEINYSRKVNGASRANQSIESDSDPSVQIVDVGEIEEGSPLTAEAVFCNRDKVPFSITSIEKSCSCQSVKLSNKGDVAPGKSLTVSTMINTRGMKGPFEKTVVLSTSLDTRQSERLLVVIRGNVVKDLDVVPDQVFLGAIRSDVPSKAIVEIVARDSGIIESVRGVKSSSDFLAVKITNTAPRKLTLEVEATAGNSGGAFFEAVTVEFDHERHSSLQIPVRGYQPKVVRTIPRIVTFESFAALRSQKVRIEAQDGQEFAIKRVSTPAGINAGFVDQKCPRHTVTVELASGPIEDLLGHHVLTVYTDIVADPKIVIPIVVR